MTKPRIIVTGATGKTGSVVVTELLKAGYPVRAMVRREELPPHRARASRRGGHGQGDRPGRRAASQVRADPNVAVHERRANERLSDRPVQWHSLLH